MPIMTRMRDSMPAILIGLLVAFLITIVFEWGMDYLGLGSGQASVVGKVNGKEITYQDFTELVRVYSEDQKTRTGVEPDENQVKQVREQAWQDMLTQYILEEEVQRLGLTVTDQELVDWVRGDNPPEDLRRNFVDSLGQFRKDLYNQFLNNPNQFIQDPQGVDPSYGTKWLANYEKGLRQRRMREKLQSVALATVRVSEGEVVSRYIDQSQQFEAVYATFDVNQLVKDDQVEVTDDDLKRYYQDHLDEYKVLPSRTLKYVLFLEKASAADSSGRENEIRDVAGKARSGMDFMELMFTYSDRPDSGLYFKHGELNPDIEGPVFSARTGDIVGPILSGDGYHLIKILEERKSDQEYVQASHILIRLDGEDSVAAKATAQKVLRSAREGGDFAGLASEYSQDPGSAKQGGSLGWFTKGRMVKPFEDAVFKAKPGEVVGPVRTQFGLHIIKVGARDSRELKIADIRMSISPGSQTKNELYDRAVDFAHNARQSEFTREATSSGFDVRETEIQESGGVIPGVGFNESVNQWAFNNSVGSVSDPYTVSGGHAVFLVGGAKDAGMRPFDEVKEGIRPLVLRQKKVARTLQIADELRAKLGPADSLSRLAELNAGVRILRAGPLTAQNAPTIGRDPVFLGTLGKMSVGEVSRPVEALRNVVVIQLVSKTPFDSTAFAAQKEVLKSQILQEKRNRFLTEWLAKLKEEANIEDHRDTFFR